MKIINDDYHSLEQFSEKFLAAKPFPHLVLDNFLDADFFATLDHSTLNKNTEARFNSEFEFKKTGSMNSELSGGIAEIVDTLNSEEWVAKLRALSNIETLQSTAFGNTDLSNYHEMEPGGFLAPHVDHSYETKSGLPHVFNVIVYVSPEWQSEFGGGTFLYDSWGKKIVSKVEYKPNRAVLFLNTPYSFHCVERLSDNNKNIRKSIYVDYYSSSFNPYKDLPLSFPKRWFKHGTAFRLNRFTDYLKPKNKLYTKLWFDYRMRRLGLIKK